ncbi:hypothetical protein QYM36_000640 [Artemia franciscana]|uniref:Uncharacterized protein n=1 Tax=Artemia franciscana TaxID=6661 RepID=A0AA88LJM8_ARTSF|nr:hypothetical protein QYM36_000640 [Artemia franciscana]
MTSPIRSQTRVYLLGHTVTKLDGSKLPSIRMALGLFLHNHLEKGETIRQSLTSTIKEIATFWYKARIPTGDVQYCRTKLEKLFEEWHLLKKNKGRQSVKQQSREAEFLCKPDNLFDIAHANAMNIMKIPEDKQFLLAQREKGRKGAMVGGDEKLAEEKQVVKRLEKTLARQQTSKEREKGQNDSKMMEMISSSSSDEEDTDNSDDDTVSCKTGPTQEKRQRVRKVVITPQLAATLDRTKMSDRKANFVISETAKIWNIISLIWLLIVTQFVD